MIDRERRLDCANGVCKADLVLKHGRILNVFTEEIIDADVAICGDTIVGVGSYEGIREVDCTGKYLVPGFLDAHMHIESSMVAPGELAKVLVQAGTTTIIADPHEIVNVCGTKGMDYFLRCANQSLVDIFYMVPSSVPATDVETNGCGQFLASDMMKYVDNTRVLGLGETMRFAECATGERRMADKLELFQRSTSTDMRPESPEKRCRRTALQVSRTTTSAQPPRKCSISCAPDSTSISERAAVRRIWKRSSARS